MRARINVCPRYLFHFCLDALCRSNTEVIHKKEKTRRTAADTHMERSKTHWSSRRLHNYLWRIRSSSSERGFCMNKATQPGLNLLIRDRLQPLGLKRLFEKVFKLISCLPRWPPCDFCCEFSHSVQVDSLLCRHSRGCWVFLTLLLYHVGVTCWT